MCNAHEWVCWPASCGGENGERRRLYILHKEISRGLLILGLGGGAGGKKFLIFLMDKIKTFSCIMMSKCGENFNAYLIGKASA